MAEVRSMDTAQRRLTNFFDIHDNLIFFLL